MAYPRLKTGCPLCVTLSCNFSLTGRSKNTLNIFNNLTVYPQCTTAPRAHLTSLPQPTKRTHLLLSNKQETGSNLSVAAKLGPCKTQDCCQRLNPTISKVQVHNKCPNARVTSNTYLRGSSLTGWLTSISFEQAHHSKMLCLRRLDRHNAM